MANELEVVSSKELDLVGLEDQVSDFICFYASDKRGFLDGYGYADDAEFRLVFETSEFQTCLSRLLDRMPDGQTARMARRHFEHHLMDISSALSDPVVPLKEKVAAMNMLASVGKLTEKAVADSGLVVNVNFGSK